MFSPTDTIVAIATPGGRGGIGVVRISGPRAAAVARELLTAGTSLPPRYATHTFARTARRIDEVVATYFPAPHSYTTEDVVEISAHGSPVLLREIVAAAIAAGARLAEPGEFTFRAFLNGRLDLVQAEAVGDLINAVTPLQARVAFDQLEGTLTGAIGALDARLFDLVTRLEASLDFPEEGYHFIEPAEVAGALTGVRDGIDALLGSARVGRMIREGRQIAIVGRPNVGKSTLFNRLVGADRAIVTAAPGTTRDLLRETIDFDGVQLSLVDTAGIRNVDDEAEREGVARAHGARGVADLVVVMLDASRPLEEDDRDLLASTRSTPRVVVANKIDLPRAWIAIDGGERAIDVSVKSGAGLEDMRAAMRRALEIEAPPSDEPLVTNLRHETLLRAARESVDRARCAIGEAGETLCEELVLADLSAARHAFEHVVGRRTSDDVLRAIFERFCIGK